MKANVLGVSKIHSKKTDKDYYIIYVSYQNKSVDGLACGGYFCSSAFYESAQGYLGAEIDCSINFNTNSISFPYKTLGLDGMEK